MSQEDVEIVLANLQAIQRGERERTLETFDADVELDQSRMPDGGVYHGRDAVSDFYARWTAGLEE